MPRLGDLVSVDRRTVQPETIAEGQAYVGLEQIETGGRIASVASVGAGDLRSAKFAFDERHVLFGKLRPNLAKVARPDFAGICSTDIVPLLPGPQVDRDYLAHFLLAPSTVQWTTSRAVGVNLPRISPSVLESLEFPLPPLPEQRRIASILDNADSLRHARRSALDLAAEARARVIEDFFEHTGGGRRSLGSLITRAQNGIYVPSADYGAGTPILRIADYGSGGTLGQLNLQRVRIADDDAERFRLEPEDIVVNRVNALSHIGKAAIVESTDERTVFESNIMRITADRSQVAPRYLSIWLSTSAARSQVRGAAKQAINQASINQQDVRALEVPLPSLSEQGALVSWVVEADRLALTEGRHLALLDELFASLQHLAFRGDL